jgi:hypothetical protein
MLDAWVRYTIDRERRLVAVRELRMAAMVCIESDNTCTFGNGIVLGDRARINALLIFKPITEVGARSVMALLRSQLRRRSVARSWFNRLADRRNQRAQCCLVESHIPAETNSPVFRHGVVGLTGWTGALGWAPREMHEYAHSRRQ